MNHINSNEFINAINSMIESNNGDFYIGLFTGAAMTVAAIMAMCMLSITSSVIGWLLSRYGKTLFEKVKSPGKKENEKD